MLTEAQAVCASYSCPSWWAWYTLNGAVERFPHVRLLASKLRRVESGECSRLIINMPPQHGKSELASKAFPSWCLGRHPDWKLICASYGKDLSEDAGRANREKLEAYGEQVFGVRVDQADRSVFSWGLDGFRGSLTCVGVGSGTTGKPADGIVIDDPVKNWEEAISKSHREKIWAWYQSVIQTRLSRTGWIVLIQTRWHQDDLTGRLLKAADEDPLADQWEVVTLPALDDEDRALCDQLHPADQLKRMRATMAEFMWSALYANKPKPAEGVIWEPELFVDVFYPGELVKPETVHASGFPKKCTTSIITVDTAFGGAGGDDQAICVLGMPGDGHLYVKFGLSKIGLQPLAAKVVRMALDMPAPPAAIFIEEQAYVSGGGPLENAVRAEFKARGTMVPIQNIPISEHEFEERPKGGRLKELRIMQLDRAIRSRQFRFIDTPETRRGVDQITEFRLGASGVGHHFDAPDALARAYAKGREIFPQVKARR